jgi:Icc-related predicted phosphoesterase
MDRRETGMSRAMATNGQSAARIRVAAAGDIHADESRRVDLEAAFAGIRGEADLVLLAGDLTTHGLPEEAQVVADAARLVDVPVFTVLGNHDWHSDRADEVTAVLEDAGVTVLQRSWTTCDVGGIGVGVVGAKGFIGGFPGSHLPDFGEPLLREVYAYGTAEVEAIDEGLRATAECDLQIVLLHYAPTLTTIEGERPEIAAFLGNDRLAHPIADHHPDLVLHGHAHAGRFDGRIGTVPVFNVALPMKREFWLFDLSADRTRAPEYELIG